MISRYIFIHGLSKQPFTHASNTAKLIFYFIVTTGFGPHRQKLDHYMVSTDGAMKFIFRQ